jgi:putative membrane protein
MSFVLKLIISTVAVLAGAYLVGGVNIANNSIFTAVLVALVLGFLNSYVKPILELLTIPVTIVTLGLFLIVINVLMIYLAAWIVPGFQVNGFFAALLFSIVMAVVGWILESVFGSARVKNS